MSKDSNTAGRVLHGTCGWSDRSIYTCGRFYPAWARSAEERLEVYSQHFPCVEVDSSCYAIPSSATVAKWVARVRSPVFKFHFKAFGMLCASSVPVNTLPAVVRAALGSAAADPQARVTLQELEEQVQGLVWEAYNSMLEPAVKTGKCGCVVFQFQLSFPCIDASYAFMAHCRARLRQDVCMAVELRNRSWFKDEAATAKLVSFCRLHGLVLVAADELAHETVQKDREQRGLPAGVLRRVLPIALQVTAPSCLYVRLHRRHGTSERTLPHDELQAWSTRLAGVCPALQGPVYFLWGTDWEDAPLVNARSLDALLPAHMVYGYKALLAGSESRRAGSIYGMFAASGAKRSAAHSSANMSVPADEGIASDPVAATQKGEVISTSPLRDQHMRPGSSLHEPRSAGAVTPALQDGSALAEASSCLSSGGCMSAAACPVQPGLNSSDAPDRRVEEGCGPHATYQPTEDVACTSQDSDVVIVETQCPAPEYQALQQQQKQTVASRQQGHIAGVGTISAQTKGLVMADEFARSKGLPAQQQGGHGPGAGSMPQRPGTSQKKQRLLTSFFK